MSNAIKRHSQNKKVFEYKNKAILLICATEHYGAVMNRPFDYKAYLCDCKAKKQNYTRLFLLFRELQTKENPYSTCKPESPDYISPFKPTAEGIHDNRKLKYDLEEFNEEFFERLHDFMSFAKECNVIAEIVLFSNSYSQGLFELIPLCSKNNINNIEDVHFSQAMSKQNTKLFEYQKKYVKKVVHELNQYPNFIFEICNEPVCFTPDIVTAEEINAWQNELISLIRNEEKDLPNQHLIAAEECWNWHPGKELVINTNYNFSVMDADIINIHPLENIIYNNKRYNMGEFMSKSLCLDDYKAFCLDTYHEDKILNMDEDNVASMYKDYDGWTIHRKRAWTAAMCGASYDYIDFSILVNSPTGTAESQKYIRTWYKYLQEYISSMDLVCGRPLSDFATCNIPNTIVCVYGATNKEYNIYIADKRELDTKDYGSALWGDVWVNINDVYTAYIYSPQTGTYSIGVDVPGSTIKIPKFNHDIVIKIVRK